MTINSCKWAVLAMAFLLTSCIKDEEGNKECDILKAWVEGDEYKPYFSDENQMFHEVSSGESEIVFTVRSLISLPKQIPLQLSITDKATVVPASGTPQDFTQGPVSYTVTSEDGQWSRTYKVLFQEVSLPTYKFSFEHVATSEVTASGCTYHEFYEQDSSGQRFNIWSSGNAGAAMTLLNKKPTDFPTFSVEDGYQGKGLCLQTISAGSLGEMFKKPIAAGTLFLGKFMVENVLFNTLKTTQFGITIDREPVRVTGYYKYRPGEKFTNKDMKEVVGKEDQADIYAVFYKNRDEQGNEVYLYGDDVLTSPHIVSVARVAALPPCDEWTRFEMFFDDFNVDAEMLTEKKFNLALVFSSSKEGANFEGAIGSILYVDEVEVSFEE